MVYPNFARQAMPSMGTPGERLVDLHPDPPPFVPVALRRSGTLPPDHRRM